MRCTEMMARTGRPAAIAIVLALFAGLLATGAKGQSLEDVRWLSEEYAPINYSDDGVPAGISVEIVAAMWERLGLQREVTDIRILPWARGYRMAQDDPDTCLFATTITEPRRKLFHFVEPLLDVRIVLIGHRDSAPAIDTIADLEPYRIGVVRDDIGEHLLHIAGANSTLVRTDSARIMVRMLRGGRFDLIAYDQSVARWSMQEEGLDPAEYVDVHVLEEADMGIACNRDMDPALIARMQEALDHLIADGTVDGIIASYRD